MIFCFRRVRLKIHLLLLSLWVISFISGNGLHILATILALLFHEGGHLFMARIMKISVTEIEIMPHGGLMILDGIEEAIPPLPLFFMAFAGPINSLIGCFVAGALYELNITDFTFARDFAQRNMLMFLFNLFPALPLDGGQMLRAILSHFFSWQKATRILTTLGCVFGILICLLSFIFALQGDIILSPAFAGLYILYAATLTGKNSTVRYVTALIARRNKLDHHNTLPVEWLAASESMPLQRIISQMKPGKYHMLSVLSNDGMEQIGILNEQEICDNLLSDRNNLLLSDCIGKKK